MPKSKVDIADNVLYSRSRFNTFRQPGLLPTATAGGPQVTAALQTEVSLSGLSAATPERLWTRVDGAETLSLIGAD